MFEMMKGHEEDEPDFCIQDLLGEGSFAKVYKCIERKTQAPFALKEFDTKNEEYDEGTVQTEIKIWKDLQHDRIVRLYASFRTGKYLYFVMDFLAGGNLLEDMLGRQKYSEKEAASLLRQILEALQYLHSRKIVHRDVKPDNILLSGKLTGAKRPVIAKIGDFGFAVKLPRDRDVICCQPKGAPMYLAPETILEDPIGCPVDSWSCGILLHTLIVGYPPFWNEDNEKMLLAAVRGQFSLTSPCWNGVSQLCKNLIKNLLTVNSSQRITPMNALKHPWIFKMALALPVPPRKENKFLSQQSLTTGLKSTLLKMHSSLNMQSLGVSRLKGRFFPLHHSAQNLTALSGSL
ncbi:calcium/calmodulin-dependent protein kinase type II subunit gamma isoform X2 [Nematostella vectensis]|nr:calcium/calmodulin-dependent protein kinase type II subunit gamma isoform X2 [Nematostella vectensis]